MKKILYIVAAGAMMLTACNKDNDAPDGQQAVQFSAAITTRAAGTNWSVDDQIGAFMKTAGYPLGTTNLADNVRYTNAAGGFTAATPIYYPQSGAVDFVAYYPYRATPAADPYLYKVDVATQTNPATIDLLWSNNAVNKTKSAAAVALQFDHMLSRVVLNIKPGTGMTAADMAGITVKIAGMPTAADFSLANGTLGNLAGASTDLTPIAVTPASGYTATFAAIVVPQGAGAWSGRKLVFTVGGANYDHAIPDGDDFASGREYAYDIAVDATGVSVSRSDVTDWTTTAPEAVAPIQLPAMVLIPAGTFLMGSSDGTNIGDTYDTGLNTTAYEPNRNPNETQHRVTLTKDFYMSKYPITNAQYAVFLNAKNVAFQAGISNQLIYGDGGKCTWGDNNGQIMVLTHNLGVTYNNSVWKAQTGYENHPVINVTWYGAYEYAVWAGGSLPTEAQWEYACRGGQENRPFGIGTGYELNNTLAIFHWAQSWSWDGSSASATIGSTGSYPATTQAVGTYPYANGYGLYDMHGNVWEWCLDQWDGSSNYSSLPPTDPLCTTGYGRVDRGGSWLNNAQHCRSAYRSGNEPADARNFIGFRVVLVP